MSFYYCISFFVIKNKVLLLLLWYDLVLLQFSLLEYDDDGDFD